MRFKPTRAGIFNIWEYDDQTFEFGDGRLALRGRNGSGKSNALSLLFPFVFDGVMSAARMDPMGGGRSMKSLLLGRDDTDRAGAYRHDSGTGYVWMEFDNGTEFVTTGIGVSATRQREADPWFFVTHRQVGIDFDLAENNIPLGRRQLHDRLGDGSVFATAEQFRNAVDRELLGLGATRYRRIVDLLLTLRRPQLAGKFDIEHLSTTLSAGLGELDPALVDDVAHSFDDLDAMQHQLAELETALGAVERFLPIYRIHLIGVGRERANALVTAHASVKDLQRKVVRATRERGDTDAAIAELTRNKSESADERRTLEARIENIQQSPAYRNSVALDEVSKSADRARAETKQADRRVVDAEASVASVGAVVDSARADVADASGHLDARIAEWYASARAAGIDVDGTLRDFDEAAATTAVAERRHAHDEIRELAREAARVGAEAERAETSAAKARAALDAALDARDTEQQLTQNALAALADRRSDWAGRLRTAARRVGELVPGSVDEWFAQADPLWATDPGTRFDDVAAVDADVDVDIDPSGVLSAAATAIAASAAAERMVSDLSHVTSRAVDSAAAAVTSQQLAIDKLDHERQAVADEPNPGPPQNPTRPDSAGTNRPGTPLYVCVDFADTVDETARAGIEAALSASGILDALVTRDDRVDVGLDAALHSAGTRAPTSSSGQRTLADLLMPVDVPGVDSRRVADLLRSLPLEDDIVKLGADGAWRLGPIAGRFTQPAPQFIGHAAREARRATRLAELDKLIGHAQADLRLRLQHSEALVSAAAEIETLRSQQPSTESAERSLTALRAAYVRVDERAARNREALDRASELARQADAASGTLHATAARLRMPATTNELRGIREDLDRCGSLQRHIAVDRIAVERAERVLRDAEAQQREAVGRVERYTADATAARTQADLEAQRFDELSHNVGGDARRAVEELTNARSQRAAIDERLSGLEEALASARSELAKLEERIEHLDSQRSAAQGALERAERQFAVIRSAEIAEVLALDGVDASVDPAAAAKALLALSDPAPAEATNHMEKAHREILLDGLRSGHDPSMPKIDGIDVVRVATVEGDQPIGTLARQLRDQYERTAQLLTKSEREIFETHLLSRVGDSVRGLLLEADAFEHRINEEMSKIPTESGMVVELRWEVSGDEGGIADAVASLRTAPEMLGPDRREALREFFMRRIGDLRSTEPGSSFAETLTAALDYRRWHSFSLYARFADGKRQRVTRKFYRGLSGGEAATLLHLPLFAAAAAQYSNGTVDGPRLVALDEAFVGIDDQMRARLMGLLTELDLDIILTSHEIWGFYETVPKLVLYDLVRSPTNPGVYAQRLDWTSNAAPTGAVSGG